MLGGAGPGDPTGWTSGRRCWTGGLPPAGQALDYAQNLRQYAFVPRGIDLAEYGRELAVRDGVIPKSGLLAECFDCRAYAEAYMNQHGLSATDHGYVAWNGGEIYYEYSQPEQSNSPSLSM